MCHGSAVSDGTGRYRMGSDGIRTQQKQSDRRQPPVLQKVFYRSARVRVPPWACKHLESKCILGMKFPCHLSVTLAHSGERSDLPELTCRWKTRSRRLNP